MVGSGELIRSQTWIEPLPAGPFRNLRIALYNPNEKAKQKLEWTRKIQSENWKFSTKCNSKTTILNITFAFPGSINDFLNGDQI